MEFLIFLAIIAFAVIKSISNAKSRMNQSKMDNSDAKFTQYFGQNFESFTNGTKTGSTQGTANNYNYDSRVNAILNSQRNPNAPVDNFTKHFGTDLNTLLNSTSNANTTVHTDVGPRIPIIASDSLSSILNARTEEAKNYGITIISSNTSNVHSLNSKFTSMVSFVLSSAVDICKRSFLKEIKLDIVDNGENISIVAKYPMDKSDNTDTIKFLAEGMGGTFTTVEDNRLKILEISIPKANAY
ncbi:MAG: hypothetical protein IJZ65_02925 [Ruminiclostridium sp.]|nr:hypothetical protein [Ruminiclostridium sp.]MBQ8841568.1 hypothetical protein [Ruminiclostridium sp.]